MNRPAPRVTAALVSSLMLAACAGPLPPATPTLAPPTATAPAAGLANPASVNCETVGGRLELVTLPDGQVGVCVLPDGSLCEEWALFRAECQPGQFQPFTLGLEPGPENAGDRHCLEGGGQLAWLRLTSGAEYGLCVWPTGKVCEQGAVAGGECGP